MCRNLFGKITHLFDPGISKMLVRGLYGLLGPLQFRENENGSFLLRCRYFYIYIT